MRVIFYILLLCILVSCKPTIIESDKKDTTGVLLQRVNKVLLEKDVEIIEAYAYRRNWELEVSETGLFYIFNSQTDSIKTKKGDRVSFKYTVELLDGTLCYSSDSDGIKTFKLGYGGVEAGLEEALLMMHLGDKAVFIMPPHLAHGLTGDGNKIGARKTIVYHVELIEIKNDTRKE